MGIFAQNGQFIAVEIIHVIINQLLISRIIPIKAPFFHRNCLVI